ncbi:MAG: ABC transporter permease [Gemmatimonadaceae bacterium]
METLARDLRFAVRTLLKQPGFTAVAVAILALGIGANVSVFSIANALLLRPPALVRAPEELVRVSRVNEEGALDAMSYPDYEYVRDRSKTFSAVAAYGAGATPLIFRSGTESEQVDGTFASGNFFSLLGVTPAVGRTFLPDDDRQGAPYVALITDALWARRFGRDRGAVGSAVTINGHPFTVVGVLPAAFRGAGVDDAPVELWMPVWARPVVTGRSEKDLVRTPNRVNTWLAVLGRLAPGATAEQAQAEVRALARQLAQAYEENRGIGAAVTREFAADPTARATLVTLVRLLAAVAAVVLLIACANLANLMLVRASARGREIALRRALGATGGRIARQLLTESLILALAGAGAGVVVGMWTGELVLELLPLSVAVEPTPDARVLGFALLLAVVTGVTFGLAPALRAARPDLALAIKGSPGRAGARSGLRSSLVVAQVALSFLLLVGAGLFVRTLQRVRALPMGFDVDHVLVLSLDLRPYGYTDSTGTPFYRELLGRVRALPGVRSASLDADAPLAGSRSSTRIQVEGVDAPPGEESFSINTNTVASDYFRTLGIPLIAGRGFTDRDDAAAPGVAIVNEVMARRFWPGASAIGKRIRLGARSPWLEVVGVVRDGRHYSVREDPVPMFFLPFLQAYEARMQAVVRTTGDPAALTPAVRQVVRELNANLAITSVRTLDALYGRSVQRYRVNATLVGALGALALALAAVGLYGVIAFVVAQRTREIGIRMALGAGGGHVVRQVVRGGMRLAVLGVAIGAVGALAATRVVTRFLFGVTPTDPAAYLLAASTLLVAALLATYLPARRAARVDPLVALRAE